MPASNVSYELFNDPNDIRAKSSQLVALVQSGPAGPLLGASSQAPLWEGMLGPALLSKAAGTLESMTLLMPSRRRVDAMTLLRTLFENAVVFSWIAIQPGDRVDAWYRTSYYWELEEFKDMQRAGFNLRSPEEVEELQAKVGRKGDRLPGVPTMAAQADEYWGARVPGWSPTSAANDPGVFSSLRGLYRYIYQRGSAAAHSRARGLDPFVTVDENTVAIHPEREEDDYHPYSLGLYTLAFAIGASEQSIGWPSWREAMRILEREAAIYPQE